MPSYLITAHWHEIAEGRHRVTVVATQTEAPLVGAISRHEDCESAASAEQMTGVLIDQVSKAVVAVGGRVLGIERGRAAR